MLNIHNFASYISPELKAKALDFILNNNIISMSEDDIGCYNANIRVNGVEYWAEVTLDDDKNIEDAYCPLCGPTLCVHTTAMCLRITDM